MNSQKRHKLKERMNKFFRYGWLVGLILLLTGIALRISFNINDIYFALLCTVLMIGGIIIAIVCHLIGTNISLKLRIERDKLVYGRYTLHLSRFYDSINNKELDKSLYIFNNFICSNASKKISNVSSGIAQGVLLGVVKENYNIVSEDTKDKVEKRLNLIMSKL